jgi:hypothetical protein
MCPLLQKGLLGKRCGVAFCQARLLTFRCPAEKVATSFVAASWPTTAIHDDTQIAKSRHHRGGGGDRGGRSCCEGPFSSGTHRAHLP